MKLIDQLQSPSLLQDREKFYRMLWSNLIRLNNEEKAIGAELSAGFVEQDEQNLPFHLFTRGLLAIHAARYLEVLEHHLEAASLFQKHGRPLGHMASQTMISNSYRSMGQLDKAQSAIQVALQHADSPVHDELFGYFRSVTYYQAAEINVELRAFEAAIPLYQKGIPFSDENSDSRARLLNGLGMASLHYEKWEEAHDYLQQALAVIAPADHVLVHSKVISDIGIYHFRRGDLCKAQEFQLQSLEMRLKRGLLNPALTNYLKLAEISLADGRPHDCIEYAGKAAKGAEEIRVRSKEYEAHEILSRAYEQTGDHHAALQHYRQYTAIREQVHNDEVVRRVEQMKSQNSIEIAQQEKEIFRLNNVELKAALKEITESFRYAQRLQQAILPTEEALKALLPESFVFFQPKDIVSGDFYWTAKNGDKIFIAVADCTGHGVPGALLSIIGFSSLSRCIREFGKTKPSEILDELNCLVEQTFSGSDQVSDGMDISLCAIDLKAGQIEWAGANNPLWLLREGKLLETKADKQPVGRFENRMPFRNHTIQLQKRDHIYLFSDGFPDQFGGSKGKKFLYKQFAELLVETSVLDVQQQKDVIKARFCEWKGDLEQTDDVTVLGFRY